MNPNIALRVATLHHNHYSFDDLKPVRKKEYSSHHKYCMIKYNFKDSKKEYTHIWTGDNLELMEKKLYEFTTWENHVRGIQSYRNRRSIINQKQL